MISLVIAAPAARDLAAIIDYIAADNPDAAQRVFSSIVKSAETLPQFPNLGRTGRHTGTRELSVAGLPYVIVYQVGADVVTIVAIFHTARDLARVVGDRMGGV
ncbi:MAG: type II toxin-antitoxin system RelE/ParE family toxin [Cypionkella sp.]|nr:type II toxin-antitoxin system RelE/ParE family toxin [Cypionkella sp.]